MMKTTEMKTILFNKLKDENCNFKKSDISIKKVKSNDCQVNFEIAIEGQVYYKMIAYYHTDDYDNKILGYDIFIYDKCFDEFIYDNTSKIDFDFTHAMIYLGYHIANTF